MQNKTLQISAKNCIFKTEDNVPACKLLEKKIRNFFCRPKSHWRKELDPDPLVRGTEPRIRIRTKMSQIPNSATMYKLNKYAHGKMKEKLKKTVEVVHLQGSFWQARDPVHVCPGHWRALWRGSLPAAQLWAGLTSGSGLGFQVIEIFGLSVLNRISFRFTLGNWICKLT